MNEALLTVKCVRIEGHYDIWPARMVAFHPVSSIAADPGQERDLVKFEMPDGNIGSFDRGLVYVTNSAGKTIDTINLDGPYRDKMVDDLRAQKAKRDYDAKQAAA